jgi:DNA methyltransferase 1-associated protein 1
LNKKNDVIEYTEEEYEKIISLFETDWTKEETDELFALCKSYDLRFFIVNDRFSNPKKRSLEEIKNRYFSVAKLVVMNRKIKKPNLYKSHPLLNFTYDVEYDKERRVIFEKMQIR